MVLIKNRKALLKFLFLSLLIFGCSGDDLEEENYFSAQIDGEKFEVTEYSGIMESDKRISDFGTVDLFVKMESQEGKVIEFLILNYNGKREYSIGKGYYNESWMKYSQIEPAGSWNANRKSVNLHSFHNKIQIMDDNGKKISGQFTFQGHDESSGSLKTVTEGEFKIAY